MSKKSKLRKESKYQLNPQQQKEEVVLMDKLHKGLKEWNKSEVRRDKRFMKRTPFIQK